MMNKLPASWIARITVTLFPNCPAPGPCWNWTGAMNGPYGKVHVGRRTLQAHRAVYELLIGPIPAEHENDHLCFNQACVNPTHQEPVTRAENMARLGSRP